MTHRHDPDSVTVHHLDETEDWAPNPYEFWGVRDGALVLNSPIPASVGAGKSVRAARLQFLLSQLERCRPEPAFLGGRCVYYDEFKPDFEKDWGGIEYLKSLVKDEAQDTEQRSQNRKRDGRKERKARDYECKAQQRRARNQCYQRR